MGGRGVDQFKAKEVQGAHVHNEIAWRMATRTRAAVQIVVIYAVLHVFVMAMLACCHAEAFCDVIGTSVLKPHTRHAPLVVSDQYKFSILPYETLPIHIIDLTVLLRGL